MKLRFDTTFQLAMHFLTTKTTFSSRSNQAVVFNDWDLKKILVKLSTNNYLLQ